MNAKAKLPECAHCGVVVEILGSDFMVGGTSRSSYTCPGCGGFFALSGEDILFAHATAKLEASEALNAELLEALEEAYTLIIKHHDMSLLRREPHEALGKLCPVCCPDGTEDGVLEKIKDVIDNAKGASNV